MPARFHMPVALALATLGAAAAPAAQAAWAPPLTLGRDGAAANVSAAGNAGGSFSAGAKVTAVGGGSGGRTLLSDWTS